MLRILWAVLFGFSLVGPLSALTLESALNDIPADEIFPGTERVEPDPDNPHIARVFQDAKEIGLIYLNADIVNATGYSGKPIHILVALDMQGVLRHVALLEHHEPIVLIGIPERKILGVIESYIGMDIVALMRERDRELPYDAVSGATVTVRVIDDSIVRSAMKLVRLYGLGGVKPRQPMATRDKVEIDVNQEEVYSWDELAQHEALTRLRLTQGDVAKAFASTSDNGQSRLEGPPDEVFIDLYTASLSVPAIARSLLGEAEYKHLVDSLHNNRHAVFIAAKGPYSFKGSGFVRGGIFDRFEIIQNDDAIRFRDIHDKRLRRVAAQGAPEFQDVDILYIPDDVDFDAAQPWHIELLVGRQIQGQNKEFVTFKLDYKIPSRYLKTTTQEAAASPLQPEIAELDFLEDAPPLWKSLWQDKLWQIVVLSLALLLLTWMFFFQEWLVKRPRLLNRMRTGFLLFTFFGIGLYANAQLSVVNIFTAFNAMVTSFDWGYFLMEPLIFIIWGGVFCALLFWGRGAYCGWLCPFGALQELVNKLAKTFRVPQIKVPWKLHERLWSVKYIIFLVLFGVSLHSLSMAERMAEVEPFKTAIVLKFIREWPFVVFALIMVAASLFIERFYCRYLCPLGAALAIPGRLRMFDWLKRYNQCGSPCQQCANECMVQAIHPEGNINPNECVYCQHCQVLYYDDHRCPVMVQKRLKRERREGKSSTDTSKIAVQILDDIKRTKQEKSDT